jgi:hypothetical protein
MALMATADPPMMAATIRPFLLGGKPPGFFLNSSCSSEQTWTMNKDNKK